MKKIFVFVSYFVLVYSTVISNPPSAAGSYYSASMRLNDLNFTLEGQFVIANSIDGCNLQGDYENKIVRYATRKRSDITLLDDIFK